MKKEHQCWDFVMSSLARTYGVSAVKSEESFHIFALEWCDEHNYICDVNLGDLREIDDYFQKQYENWQL